MINVVYYIFENEQDMSLYSEPEKIFARLLLMKFKFSEIVSAIGWFKPFLDENGTFHSIYKNSSVRHLNYFEQTYISKELFNNIIKKEQGGFIDAYQRDMLIDRLSILAQYTQETQILDKLLLYLINHFNNRYNFLLQKFTNALPVKWNTSNEVH